MKIAVVAANGKASRAIIEELIARGHAVTAFARSENKSAAKNFVQKDIMALTKEDLAGFDAVVDGLGAYTPETLPLHTAAVTGAILCVVTGCLKEKEAYAGIDWVTIFLFAGMLSVATAMEKTGAGKMIADAVVSMMGDNPNPYVLTAVLFLISNVLTQFMSNTASAALLAPIGISIAQSVGADPKPVLMALGIAASMAFATPMATPPNTLVLGPGGFSFNDYVKVGVPMCLISLVACVIIIPIFWPF